MFCFQCQETAKNQGCTIRGVCGKQDTTANLQDLLIYLCKGIAVYARKGIEMGHNVDKFAKFITDAFFATVTNTNFDDERFIEFIDKALEVRTELENKYADKFTEELPDNCTWKPLPREGYEEKSKKVGVLDTENEDIRSLRELITYGIKGISAYNHHARVLGFENSDIFDFIVETLAKTTDDITVDELIDNVMLTGKFAVETMALLDEANTSTYGNPEITEVNLGVGKNPGILISGHDLRDMQQLLEQTKDTGVDVYTHSEMLPANYYPAFKKYDHFIGNYGNAWWKQNEEFTKFNGPIIMTTNCIIPVKDDYKDRIYTTSVVGYPGVKHIEGKPGEKDFSALIEQAKNCDPPEMIEDGTIVGGFAHHQVMQLADKVIDAIKSGAIKRFIVMAGCDGRYPNREYFTRVAHELPEDAVILTAGCAKYRYNKLDLGDIGGIPRVLDAGQCNDSYSLAVIALKLKEAFELDDINDLPISFDIAWYEQKAVAVLLALLYLGVKGMRLGPTLPAFLSPNVAKVLVENFDIKPTGDVKEDVEAMMAGK
ncbi:MAG: hydroxylamine reductase [Candidatus Zixiibacteriota bacterium]